MSEKKTSDKKTPPKKWWLIGIVTFIVIGVILSPPEEENPAEIADDVAVESAKKDADVKLNEEKGNKAIAKLTSPVTAIKTPPSATLIEINTSVFEYAKKIKLTGAIDINPHVTVMIDMSEDLPPGLATQNVVQQSYYFIQQDDVKSANTVTIIVKQAEKKIAQYTINTEKFKPNDDEPMAKIVIAASKIDSMTDEVKEFGKTIGIW
ncbi:hypothetical protein [Sporosarcina sp. NPDC096371]|uniref:hypothetical protein n=1 Tax=Sporosarcina sp. NPDC096371 TaxID=3364530 RepID=UPI0037FA007E